jgi:hypothetical protein
LAVAAQQLVSALQLEDARRELGHSGALDRFVGCVVRRTPIRVPKAVKDAEPVRFQREHRPRTTKEFDAFHARPADPWEPPPGRAFYSQLGTPTEPLGAVLGPHAGHDRLQH